MSSILSSGIITAAVLPFDESGAIDWPTLDSYIKQVAAGLNEVFRATKSSPVRIALEDVATADKYREQALELRKKSLATTPTPEPAKK